MFRLLLLKRGDYIGGLNPKTNTRKNDGNVYTYPRKFRLFYDAGVATCRADLVASNRCKALQFAASRAELDANRHRVRGVPFSLLAPSKRTMLVDRLRNTLMHGFDDFVSCLEKVPRVRT